MIFDDEFDELAGLAYRMAFQVLGSRSDAEEIAQETMTKAYVRWRRVQHHARPWICRVAINDALGRLRKRGRARAVSRVEHSSYIEQAESRLDLQSLLQSLSRRQRDVVALRFMADMSEADVAAELGISVGSVKTHSSRALAALRTRLDALPPADQTAPAESAPERTETTDV